MSSNKRNFDASGAEMEFGSKYVYTYTDSEEESVSDDEYEAGMDDRLTETSWYVFLFSRVKCRCSPSLININTFLIPNLTLARPLDG